MIYHKANNPHLCSKTLQLKKDLPINVRKSQECSKKYHKCKENEHKRTFDNPINPHLSINAVEELL